MDISNAIAETGTVLWWTVIGVICFSAGAWVLDKLDPIDYKKAIEGGNVAAAIKMSAMILGLAGIIMVAIR